MTASSARSSKVSTAGGCRPRRPIVRPTGSSASSATEPARPGVAPDVLTRIRPPRLRRPPPRPPRVVTADQVRRVTDHGRNCADDHRNPAARPRERPPLRQRPRPAGRRSVLPFPLPPKLPTKQLALARTVTARFQETTAVTIERDRPRRRPASPADAAAARRRGAPRTGARPARPRLRRSGSASMRGSRSPIRLRPVPPQAIPLDEVLAAPTLRPARLGAAPRPLPRAPPARPRARVPPNTVSLCKTNPQFVEAFLVGLNHEFARELLWREYPTDQRGTRVPPLLGAGRRATTSSRSTLEPPGRARRSTLARRAGRAARAPRPRRPAAPLPVDGHLRRARQERAARSSSDAAVKLPLFRGRHRSRRHVRRLRPDRTADARSRWWFVFEEQPTEPRFGARRRGRLRRGGAPL